MFDRKEYEGKRALRRWPKWLPVVAALALATAVTVGGTLAWLSTHTNAVTNTFTMGDVVPVVSEKQFDGKVKEEVRVGNEGNVAAYIRVALVPTWEDGKGNVKAASLDDLNITWGGGEGADAEAPGNGWIKIGDYYYYQNPVNGKVGDVVSYTSTLIERAEVIGTNEPAGYHMNLQIIADSIQAAPTTAVTTTWPVEVVNTETGEITPKS